MLRIAVRYANQVLHFDPPAGEATLGAAEDNDFVAPFPGVSRRHARIARRAGGILVSDLDSKNGLLRGERRHAELLLLPGESIQIGQAFVALEEIASSDAEIAFALPLHGKRAPLRPHRHGLDSSDTDPTFETGGAVTPGGALALVRRIETSSRMELGSATTSDLLERARKTLGADLLAVLDPSPSLADPLIAAVAGGVELVEHLAGVELRAISTPGDGLPVVRLPGNRPVLLRRLQRRPTDLVFAALLSAGSGKPAGWKLDFFDYLAEKLVPPHRELGKSSSSTPAPAFEVSGDSLVFPPGMVRGRSEAMEKLFHHLRAMVRSTLDALILGETGTGKELIAKLVHASGPTAKGPFVAINCAAIPSELLEAELFGVEARVATGVDARSGLFVKAEGGTLFLDEVGDMPEPLQAKLLRVLQEREVLAVGSPRPRKIRVRVISASNKNLVELVERGSFRADLYFRLRGMHFHVPPLRERAEDLPFLILEFASDAARRYAKQIRGISRGAIELLSQYAWPGNVRELRSEVERAVLLCADHASLTSDLFGSVRFQIETVTGRGKEGELSPAAHSKNEREGGASQASKPTTLKARQDDLERQVIREAMARHAGNRSQTARSLGITRNGLALKMKRLGILFDSN